MLWGKGYLNSFQPFIVVAIFTCEYTFISCVFKCTGKPRATCISSRWKKGERICLPVGEALGDDNDNEDDLL